MQSFSQKAILCLLAVVLAAGLRAYTISLNLPFFYDEDEAHHFNRTVNMVKSGDLNPHYFNKPSLHFYLRIPVTWAGFYWAKSRGQIESIDQIRTYDKFGLADYSFTASHPSIVKANRLLSVLLGVLLVALTFGVANQATGSLSTAFGSALIVAASPDLIQYSGIIGVDIVMSTMCWASIYFGLKYLKSGSKWTVVLSAIFAGLAMSSKYNALPIIAVPFLAVFLRPPYSWTRLIASVVLPWMSFLAASPYILIDTDQFVKNLAYEIWHYGTAGHVGHMGEPGIGQVIFYSNWLFEHAIGAFAAIAALLGFALAQSRPPRERLLVAAFPLLYLLEMSLQKANFTRNMLAFVPFAAICAAYAGLIFISTMRSKALQFAAALLFAFALAFEPASISLVDQIVAVEKVDNRNLVSRWIDASTDKDLKTALSGQLQLPVDLRLRKENMTFDQTTVAPLDLFSDGFDRIVIGDNISDFDYRSLPYLKEALHIPGVSGKQRIVKNPEVSVYKFDVGEALNTALQIALLECKECLVTLNYQPGSAGTYNCVTPEGEGWCWQRKRLSTARLSGGEEWLNTLTSDTLKIKAQLMSPWTEQTVQLWHNGTASEEIFANVVPGEWKEIEFLMPRDELRQNSQIVFFAKLVDTPAKANLSDDKRRLAFAIRNLRVTVPE